MNIKNKYTIYVDMDGVLCDFLKGAHELTGYALHTHKDWEKVREVAWKKIAEHGKDFWANLPWIDGGKVLWDFIKPYKPHILSAYPIAEENKKYAIDGKRAWLIKELKNEYSNVFIVKGIQKQNYATPLSILIDDSPRNIKQWKAKGGIGILHKNTKYTITMLKLQLSHRDRT